MLASMEKCDSMILKLDEILQKDPGFGGVIPRFLGKYLSTVFGKMEIEQKGAKM